MEILCVVVISISGLALGAYVYLKPQRMIKAQKKFYEKINWRIEPISMTKEIRNTKIMGLFLLVFILAANLYLLWRG